MNFPSDTPKLPKWIFIFGDVALLATAWFIATQSAHPTNGSPLIAIVVCVVAAGVIGAIPFVSDYARRQDEALDNRQRALQSLAATVAASAEQISIAATGLQSIAEAAQDNLGKTEQTAEQIREKIAELDARLSAARKDDGEAAARLDAVAKRISKAAADLEGSLAKAAAAAESSGTRASAQLSAASAQATAELEGVLTKSSGQLSAAAAKAAADLEAAVEKATETARAVLMAARPPLEVPPVPASRIVEIKPAVLSSEPPFEESAVTAAPTPEPAPMPEPEPAPAPEAPAPAPAAEPAPQAEPAAVDAGEPAPAPAAEEAAVPPAEAAPAEPPPAPRKRAPRKPPAPVAPVPVAPVVPELVLEPDPVEAPAEAPTETAVSADGATRLIITAYIGIGNRLFIRGEGPGLSWEKGVALTFVSIGKWRWETNEATGPVRFRIYKNDELECTALGERSVEPGAQADFTASF